MKRQRVLLVIEEVWEGPVAVDGPDAVRRAEAARYGRDSRQKEPWAPVRSRLMTAAAYPAEGSRPISAADELPPGWCFYDDTAIRLAEHPGDPRNAAKATPSPDAPAPEGTEDKP